MNKSELIHQIAENASLSKNQASAALNSTLEALTEALEKGDKVTLVGFGTFSVGYRAARKGINPATQDTIEISDKAVVKFKPGSELAKTVNNEALRAELKEKKKK